MIYTKKIVKVGNGLYISLPNEFQKLFNKGEIIKFDFNFLQTQNPKIEQFKCKVCQHICYKEFNEDNYCPACGEENSMEKFKNEE